MSVTKYQKYFQQMLDSERDLFAKFEQIHEQFKKDEPKYQAEFNEIGAKVMEVIQEWEKRLCQFSEKGVNAKYSANLAEKFWEEVRDRYSHIDLVGCE